MVVSDLQRQLKHGQLLNNSIKFLNSNSTNTFFSHLYIFDVACFKQTTKYMFSELTKFSDVGHMAVIFNLICML